MRQFIEERPEILLVGLHVRTNNANEADRMKGKIWPIVQSYFHEALFNSIPHRKQPGVTLCAYTEYESDHTGDYTYVIGEAVERAPDELPDGFRLFTIPAQRYAKFTTDPAPMPDVIINAWHAVWAMAPEQLGGERRYHTDFEVYDERAADHERVVLDLCIGIEG